MAALLGVSRVTVARWETSEPPGPTAARLLYLAEQHPKLVKRRLREFTTSQQEALDRLVEIAEESPRTRAHLERHGRKDGRGGDGQGEP